MNNNFTIITFLKMIKKNIILFLGVFLTIAIIGGIVGGIIYSDTYIVTATCSLEITENTNSQNSTTDYTSQYYETAANFINNDTLLQKTANKYNLKFSDLKNDLSFSRTNNIVEVTYTSKTSNNLGISIVDSIINNWITFIQDKQFSGVKGQAIELIEPEIRTDMTSEIVIFIAAFAIVGLALGIVCATIKSYYSRTIIASNFIKNYTNINLVSKINKNQIENELPYKRLLLEISRVNAKVICVTSIDGDRKEDFINILVNIFKNNNYNVDIIDFKNENNLNIFNFKDDSPLKSKINDLKDNDLIILNTDDSIDDNRLALNKIADMTIVNIEINKTLRKKLKYETLAMEKDNKNIIGVVIE